MPEQYQWWEVGGNLFGWKKKTLVPANFQEQLQTTSLEWKLRSQIFLKRFISNKKGIQDYLQSIVNSAPVVFSHFSPLWIWIGNTLIHFDSRSNFSICLPVEKWHLHLKLLTASRSHDIKGGGNAKEIKIAQQFWENSNFPIKLLKIYHHLINRRYFCSYENWK